MPLPQNPGIPLPNPGNQPKPQIPMPGQPISNAPFPQNPGIPNQLNQPKPPAPIPGQGNINIPLPNMPSQNPEILPNSTAPKAPMLNPSAPNRNTQSMYNKNPMKYKKCSECNQEKEEEAFSSIVCPEEYSCRVCSKCRGLYPKHCKNCKREYSPYEIEVISILAIS